MNDLIVLFELFISICIVPLIIILAVNKKNIILFFYLALAYLYTVYGFTIILIEERFGKIYFGKKDFQYDYLFAKMFDVKVNDSFSISMFAVLIFILILSLISSALVNRLKYYKVDYQINHIRTWLLSGIFIALSVSVVVFNVNWNSIAANNENLYTALRYKDELPLFYSIHQLCIRGALFVALLVMFEPSRDGRNGLMFLKIVPLIVLTLYCTLLGNRAELISFFLMASTIYAMQTRITLKALFAAVVTLTVISLIGSVRGLKIDSEFSVSDLFNPLGAIWNLISSNEFFAPVLSLYGVIDKNVDPSYLISFYWLLFSVIPRDFGLERPQDSYLYYATNTINDFGQGYAMHHITSYYINFGLVGFVLCGIVLSFIFIVSFTIRNKEIARNSIERKLFKLWMPAFVMGLYPSILRGGIEGYKGLIVEGLLLPFILIILLVCKSK
jgi:hypothetical protein